MTELRNFDLNLLLAFKLLVEQLVAGFSDCSNLSLYL